MKNLQACHIIMIAAWIAVGRITGADERGAMISLCLSTSLVAMLTGWAAKMSGQSGGASVAICVASLFVYSLCTTLMSPLFTQFSRYWGQRNT